METYGGPVFKPLNFSLNDWADEIGDELVALDRSGDPLYFLITPYSLPELPHSVVYKVIQSVKSAIELYYKFNTYRGCTNPDSPNFSFQANVDDGTCKPPNTNFTFGGVYRTCSRSGQLSTNLCSGLDQKNPLTGDYSCPPNYKFVSIAESKRSGSESVHRCHSCYLFFHCCHDEAIYGNAEYSSYWCVADENVPEQSGFLFGVLYTTAVSNPITQSKTCPLYFYPLNIGSDIKVCISDDYELGFEYSVPFAGFYSCRSGNPLMLGSEIKSSNLKAVHSLGSYLLMSGSEHWPKGCPNGYSQHIATVENGCEIDFCVKAGAFSTSGLPPVRQPPFMQISIDGLADSLSYSISADGQTWKILTEEKTDESFRTNNVKGDPGLSNSNESGLSKGAVAGISIVATVLCIVCTSIIIVKYRKYKTLYKPLQVSARLNGERTVYSSTRYGTQPVEIQVDT